MKMIFYGGKNRLMPIWSTIKKVIDKNYKEELEKGEIMLLFDFEKELTIITSNKQFTSEMKKQFYSLKGRLQRLQLRTIGVRIELKE